MQKSKKRFIFTLLIVLVGIILLLTVVYHQTSLWKPEHSLITLLPESPICYLTLKDLDGLVKAFNESEFGKQVKQMPIFKQIGSKLWWRQIVYQKMLWEYEMGGRFDMRAVKGHFGKEVILALYQRENEFSFLLITEVGGPEKLAIEAITATDLINPNYKRIKTEHNGLTINTIIGYPLDFSYTFIGKIGVLTLNPLLLAEVIDIYNDKNEGFLTKHSIKKHIQKSYNDNTNTGYVDLPRFSVLLKHLADENDNISGHLSSMINEGKFWTFENRYEEGAVVSKYQFGNHESPKNPHSKPRTTPTFIPKHTALVAFYPQHNWTQFWQVLTSLLTIEIESDDVSFYDIFKPEMTAAIVSRNEGEMSKLPSLVIHTPIQNIKSLDENIKKLNNTKFSVAGRPIEFLEVQNYKGISLHPLRMRLNILMSYTGAYAIVNNDLFLSTTLDGLKTVLDTNSGDSPNLEDITFASNGIQTYVQPQLLVPEIKRFIPLVTILASFSGIKLDAQLMQQIQDNLFPLESLGPITANLFVGEEGANAEVHIVLDK